MSATDPTSPDFDERFIELAITGGMVDHLLPQIESALKRRQDLLASEKLSSLMVGDRITLSDKISPKLLAGCPVEVIGFTGNAQVEIRLLTTRSSKWHIGAVCTIPKSLIGHTFKD